MQIIKSIVCSTFRQIHKTNFANKKILNFFSTNFDSYNKLSKKNILNNQK